MPFSAHWLWAKLVLVTVLPAPHGNQLATLHRLNADAARLTVAVMSAIVLLVFLKPQGQVSQVRFGLPACFRPQKSHRGRFLNGLQ